MKATKDWLHYFPGCHFIRWIVTDSIFYCPLTFLFLRSGCFTTDLTYVNPNVMDKISINNKESDKVNKTLTSRKSKQLSDTNWHDPMSPWLFSHSKTMVLDRKRERTIIGTSHVSFPSLLAGGEVDWGMQNAWSAVSRGRRMVGKLWGGGRLQLLIGWRGAVGAGWLDACWERRLASWQTGRVVQTSRFRWRSQPDIKKKKKKKKSGCLGDRLQYVSLLFK